MILKNSVLRSAAVSVAAISCMMMSAQAAAEHHVTTQKVTIHSDAVAGNLEGNSAERDLIIYLPPSYDKDKKRRYPVVYGLHGYSIDNDQWSTEIKTPDTIAGAFSDDTKEMIVVLPDSKTAHNGSMYSSSVTTGDFETFIADEVVAYMDANYRTIPDRRARGLAGHSMGGYGTLRVAMKRPDVFSAFYSMSPCCLSSRGAPPAELMDKLRALESVEAAMELGFMERATLAVASAWSPNPEKPPLFVDLPGDEGMETSVVDRWTANAPLVMVPQYITNLRQYNASAIDVGDKDGLKVDAEKMQKMLNRFGVDTTFEIYDGDHVSAVDDRFENHVLPFFSKNLSFE